MPIIKRNGWTIHTLNNSQSKWQQDNMERIARGKYNYEKKIENTKEIHKDFDIILNKVKEEGIVLNILKIKEEMEVADLIKKIEKLKQNLKIYTKYIENLNIKICKFKVFKYILKDRYCGIFNHIKFLFNKDFETMRNLSHTVQRKVFTYDNNYKYDMCALMIEYSVYNFMRDTLEDLPDNYSSIFTYRYKD